MRFFSRLKMKKVTLSGRNQFRPAAGKIAAILNTRMSLRVSVPASEAIPLFWRGDCFAKSARNDMLRTAEKNEKIVRNYQL